MYPNRVILAESIHDIPRKDYMVYILTFNSNPIVLGHGKKNRSKVIFDDLNHITNGHIKALFVRLYNLYGNGIFERYLINCPNKAEANKIENELHKELGGNTRNIPANIRSKLFDNLDKNSVSYLILEIIIRSSFDGLSDLKKWRTDGIISDNVWEELSRRLLLK